MPVREMLSPAPPRSAFDLEKRVETRLRSSSHGPIRRLTCEVRRRALILRGCVPSFYMKQLAQTLVRDLLSDELVVDNQIEVE
jgi:hypothetical protein